MHTWATFTMATVNAYLYPFQISTKAGAVIAPISMNKEVKIKKAEAKEKRQRVK